MNERKEWARTILSELTIISMGQSPPSSTYNKVGKGLPFFQGKAEFTERYPVAKTWCSKPKKVADIGDILISVRAPVGATNIANQPCAIGRGLAALNYSPCNMFLFYFLRLIEKELDKKGTGTTFRAISGSTLKNQKLSIPPLPEQRSIVAKIEQLFSELNNAIDNFKKAQDQLKVYRQAVLKKAFEGELTREWRKKQTDLPSADELLEQIKEEREAYYQKQLDQWQKAIEKWEADKRDLKEKGKKPTKPKKAKELPPLTEEELAELPDLPDDAIWIKLGFITLHTEYGTSAKSKKTGRVPVLRMGNIQNSKFDWGDLVFTDDEQEIKQYLLKKDDVLFNRTNSPELVGKTGIYKAERTAIFAGYLIRVNQISSLCEADYLNYFLNSHIAKVHGNSVKTDGVNQSNINGEKLKRYPFPYCSLTEQHQIVQEIESRLSVCDKVEESLKENLLKAEALRQSILKKAFEGKLLTEQELEACRKEPDWEPAENLLERIKAEKEGKGKKEAS